MSDNDVLRLFPCSACGKCCQRVGKSMQTQFLDRGDSICRHFDEKTKLCRNYEHRPLICRVEDYYRAYFTHLYTWDEFIKMNQLICQQLQESI